MAVMAICNFLQKVDCQEEIPCYNRSSFDSKLFQKTHTSYAELAQLVEQPPCKRSVAGSSPAFGTI